MAPASSLLLREEVPCRTAARISDMSDDHGVDSCSRSAASSPRRRFPSRWVDGPLIVGAGPSGMATAACLRVKGVPFTIIERNDQVGSLWKRKTYDRLHLHLPKRFCQLPMFPFPDSYPTYPTRDQFVSYLDDYAERFNIKPEFNTAVSKVEFLAEFGIWAVSVVARPAAAMELDRSGPRAAAATQQYVFFAKWLVVATGENAEAFMPSFPGHEDFKGKIMHGSLYRNGKDFCAKKVLVVGCGNTGMEVALDLANYGALPSLCIRDRQLHVLPRELRLIGLMNLSTFEVGFWLAERFPLWVADKILVFLSWLTLGSPDRYGIRRPREAGPLELKRNTGRTPVLDVGTIAKVKSGHINVVPGIERLTKTGVLFTNGATETFDNIIMATGYFSNVPNWLKNSDLFGDDGLPRSHAPHGWKGEHGLYAVGFGRKGLLGCAHDAVLVAEHIAGNGGFDGCAHDVDSMDGHING